MSAQKPIFLDADDVLEWAARLIEEESIMDFRGALSKRKRDREAAQLRLSIVRETRKDCANHIRAFKGRRDRDPLAVLRRLAELPEQQAVAWLNDAWPLAWKGWLNIKCTIQCNSNSIPPATIYAFEITQKGREALATAESAP